MHLCVLLQVAKLSSGCIKYKSFFPQTIHKPGQDIILNLKEWLKKISVHQNINEWIILFFIWRVKFFLLVGKDNKKKAITQEILL